MFNLTKNESKSLTADRNNTVHTSANRRSISLLAMLGLAALTLFSIHADAEIYNRNYALVNWGSNWIETTTIARSDYIQVKGFGQWQCPAGPAFAEYRAQVRQVTYAHASLTPQWERDCDAWFEYNFRSFNLRLMVQHWNGYNWATEYDNTISWGGVHTIEHRDIYYDGQIEGKRYHLYSATQVEGQPWMYGFIDFIDN